MAIVESAISSLIQYRVWFRWDDLRLLKSPASSVLLARCPMMSCSVVRGCCWQHHLL